MSFRWTKRPQNYCTACGHTWYPRGSNLSAHCPRCKEPAVELALVGCLKAVALLVLLPVVLLYALGYVALAVLVGVVKLGYWVARLLFGVSVATARAGGAAVAKGVAVGGAAASAGVRAGGAAAAGSGRLYEQSAPVRARAAELLLARLTKAAAAGAFVARWVGSARDDVMGPDDREVNPVSLIAKLVVFVVGTGAVAALAVKAVRGVAGLG